MKLFSSYKLLGSQRNENFKKVMNKKNLIIMGNSVVQKKNKEVYLINANIAYYLSSLSNFYNIHLVNLKQKSSSLQYLITNKKYQIFGFKNNLLSILNTNIHLIIFLIKKRPDCIFWHTGIFLPAFLVAKIFKLKTLMYIGINPKVLKNGIVNLNFRFLKIMIYFSDFVLVRGNYILKEIQKVNTKSESAYPLLPFSLEEINESNLNKKVFNENFIKILFIGKPKYEKGFTNLLKSLLKIYKSYNFIELIVVGDYKLVDEKTKSLITKIKKVKNLRIIFKGYINNPIDLINVYNLVDFVICPSIGFEGSPRIIDEAIILKKPIICSDKIELDQEIKENPAIIIFDPFNEKSLYEAINYLIDNINKITNYYSLIKNKDLKIASNQHKKILNSI